MAITDIDICARALILIGASPITSFDDGTTEATVASNLYEDTVKDLLSRHRWRFSTGQVQMSRLTAVPDAPNCWLTISVLSAMDPPLSAMPTANLDELLTPLSVAETDPPTVAVVPLIVQLVAVTVNTETRLLVAEDSGLV